MINWLELQSRNSDDGQASGSASTRLRQLIRRSIQSGDLPPGTRIRETDIVASLAVSRTPVREAVATLRAEQILDIEEDGLRVRQLGWGDVKDLYALRGKLEGMAASLTAVHASAAERRLLRGLCDEEHGLVQAGASPQQLAAHNRQFHRAILEAAGNRFLTEQLKQISNLMVLLGATAYVVPARAMAIQAEHDAVMQAILNADPATAETAMQQHLEQALEARLKMLSLSEEKELD